MLYFSFLSKNIKRKMPESPAKVKSQAEIIREENIRIRDSLFDVLLDDPEFADAIKGLNSIGGEEANKYRTKRKERRRTEDNSFKFFGNVPLDRRHSLRLQDKPPIFTKDDLIEDVSLKQHWKRKRDEYDLDDLEDVVYQPKRKRISTKRAERPPVILVEEVTDYMISQIATRVSQKQYSDMGTSCHQCRQKTKDQKTCCRNVDCVGVRGQFCGVCLENRYGESVATALRDPSWFCPVCREICNCSFCRAKMGKRPTGILTPMALQSGHKSVKDFLDSLKGEGDYIDEDKDPRKLLGFTKDGHFAQMGGDRRYDTQSPFDSQHYLEIIKNLERRLRLTVDPSKAFFGFSKEEQGSI